MCDCREFIPEKAELACKKLAGREVVSSNVERYGYSVIIIRPYRKDGEPSKTFIYPSVYWSFCPFCGEPI